MENHPVVTNLHLALDKSGYKQFGKIILRQPKQLNVYGLADSGAQMCLISPTMARKMGVLPCNYVPVDMLVEAAGGNNLNIKGGMFIRMYLDPDRNGIV